MKDVSIIIVNYNTVKITSECVDSIVKNTQNISYEIIIVDNASVDGSKEVFESDKRIKYIYLEENLGFGRANNVGLTYAEGRNIFFLNSDTLLINNAIALLSDFLDANHNVGVCGGNLFDVNMRPTHSYHKRFYSVWSEIDTLLHCIPSRLMNDRSSQFNHTGNPLSVAYITGADMMIPRRVLELTGAFNDKFFMYFEEAELCHRIKAGGYKVVSVPEAMIMHLEGGSSGNKSELRKNIRFQESRVVFLDLVYGERYRKMVNFFHSDTIMRLFLVKNI